jgi:serine/threonine protein kinase
MNVFLAPGKFVGPYKIIGQLGKGGMGEVYRAEDTRLHRDVAIKVLPENLAKDEQALKRFEREARALGALSHPNIVTIHDVGTHQGISFVVMELLEGETLRVRLANSALPWKEAVEIGVAVAEGLSAAHSKTVVHRDLKPENIFLTVDGRVKILDFGVARKQENDFTEATITRRGTFVGTVPYMSPEQVKCESVDARSDVFSLGSLLHEMITGRQPFQRETAAETMAAILKEDPGDLSESRRQVPVEVERIIHHCLEKNREKRFQSARDLAFALKAVLIDSSAGRAFTTERVVIRLSKRSHAVSLLLIVVLATAFIVWKWKPWSKTIAKQPELRLVSTFPGSHRMPSFSPDASMTAFVSDSGGVEQIWIKNLAQGDPIQITFGDEPSFRPRWSPLNDQIVFHRKDGIWSVAPLGGTPRKIIEGGYNPNWSSDGKKLVFEKNEEVWIANADGSNSQKVKSVPFISEFVVDRFPSFSPDNSHIAIFQSKSNDPHGDLWLVPVDGNKAERITFDEATGGTPVWTHDGESLIYSSSRGGSMTLWKVARSKKTHEPVTTGVGEDTFPEISQDGRKLIFTNVKNNFTLKLQDVDGGQQKNLLEVRNKKIVYPTFSPDGKKIAFFRELNSDTHLFTVNVDGTDPVQVTRAPGEDNIFPHWSKNGAFLYFFQTKPTNSYRKISISGEQNVTVIPNFPWGKYRFANIDPKGHLMVSGKTEGNHPVCVIKDLTTGKERAISEPLNYPKWSKDGRHILGDNNGVVFLCSAYSGDCRSLTKGIQAVWSGNESKIFFQRPAKLNHTRELWSISADGSDEIKIGEMGPFMRMDPFYDLSINDEFVWVQFSAGNQELWILEF